MVYNSASNESLLRISALSGAGLDNIVSLAVSNGLSSFSDFVPVNSTINYTPEDPIYIVNAPSVSVQTVNSYVSASNESLLRIGALVGAGLDNIVSLAVNNGIASFSDFVPVRTNINYAIEEVSFTVNPVNSQPVNLSFNTRFGQSIYDIALMLNGDLDNIVSFSNGIGLNFSDPVMPEIKINYVDNGSALTSWVKKNGYVFSTAPMNITTQQNAAALLQENGFYLRNENGSKILL